MDAQEISKFIEELNVFLPLSTEQGSDNKAVDAELLNALADYIEGADPAESSLEKLRLSLHNASDHEQQSLEERMRTAGSRRSLKLLREALQRM